MPEWKPIIRARLRADRIPQGPGLSEVVDEIAQHFDELYAAARAGGKSDEEGRAAVEDELRHLPELARAARERSPRRIPPAPEPASLRPLLISTFVRDLRHGVRLLTATPSFTLVAILTLALGIGANTAIFSVLHSLFMAPLPFPQPDHLVMLWEADPSNREEQTIVSEPNWKDWRARTTAFESTAIWEALNYNISGGTEPEQVLGMRVSAGAFPMLGVPPQLGRTFTEEEEAPGQTVVVISDALWQRRYSANPGVIGQTLRVNGEPHEIIGVMPPRFQFVNQRFQIWVPIAFNPNDHDRDSHSFMAAARLRAGVSFETARDEIEAIGRRLDAEHREGHGATITPMKQFGVEYLRPTLKALAGAVALVLLIACVNVANLLLARATARQREFSVRSALGASRWRISSQLLAEGLLLAAAGGMAGIAVAWLATTVLATTLPGSVGLAPFRAPGAVHINGQVLLFTAGLSAVTGILFSLAPMLGGSRVQTATALKSAGDRGATSRFTVLRAVLVGAEVALAVVVLGAAGLMFKSVMRLTSIDPGLDSRNVLLMTMALPQPDFYGSPVRTTFCDDVQREVGALPGVVSVGAMSHVPFEGNAGRGFRIQGRPEPARNENPSANYRLTCPGYFRSLGIPIRRGRDFGAADTTTSEGVAIINEETARRYWPNEDPIGQRIRIGSAEAPWLTIVGVVGNVKHFGLENPSRRELYRPYAQAAWPTMSVTVKTATSPMGLAPAVRAALARIDPDQPVSRIRTMAEVVFNSVGERRFPMRLLGLFSIVALLLAAIGVYGVASYLVSQRTREIGIRVALGAGRKQVTRMIVGRSLLPIAAGLVAGIIGAVFAARLLASMLYEVRPSDPMVLGSIALLLAGAAMGASWIPARRAASVDPLVVLRQE